MKNDGELDDRVDPQDLLLRTDWNAVEHCCPDVAPATPVILRELLDEDPRVQGSAFRDLAEALTRGNVFYTATAPAARYVAAILGDPRTLAPVTDRSTHEEYDLGPQTPFPLRVGLLAWLGDTAVEAIGQQDRPLGDEEDLDAFLDLAPELCEAVRPFLAAGSPEVREAALGALLPLLRLPALADRAPAFRDQVRAAALGDGPHRFRAVDTLFAWGEDVAPLL
ncbi:hypothetical protein OG429_36490 [Streptomyces sp. NBC_00190]|uniref:hypothetical protein n=1 Tax=unclassified Streptomyces TaxID=2593676 RepID=UPI002E2CF28F|nr:hypothetical protein [Streptomyces sp. NBC_00190]WSZ44281.1 hypothetical protein OG239_38955 [Streptomyces sp. NBC_00868]